MKKIPLVALVVFTFVANVALAQRSAIKVNVLSPIVRTANFSFEEKLGPETSLQIGFFYTNYQNGDTGFKGFGITPEFRYYLGETEAIEGFYIAPFLRYNKITINAPTMSMDSNGNFTTQQGEADLTAMGGGVVVGKQWVFKKRITIDMFVGPKGMSRNIKVKSGREDDFKAGTFGGFGIRTGVTFGIAF